MAPASLCTGPASLIRHPCATPRLVPRGGCSSAAAGRGRLGGVRVRASADPGGGPDGGRRTLILGGAAVALLAGSSLLARKTVVKDLGLGLEDDEDAPAPLPQPGPGQEVATFAGGCFW